MEREMILVTGGSRSGKSSFAERLTAKRGRAIAYIATAQILDEEMRLRVDLHRARRPAAWTTYEAPYNAAAIIRQAAVAHDTILFDCVTVYIGNFIIRDDLPAEPAERLARFNEYINQLVAAAAECGANVVFVTNEVGAGIVPDNQLAREYRDWAGLANQRLAAAAAKVYLVVSGIPVELKKIRAAMEE